MGSWLSHRGAMSNIKTPGASRSPATSTITTRADRCHRSPLDSIHPCGSMRRCAGLLALRHDPLRTRHSCYRAMQLIHESFGQDPPRWGKTSSGSASYTQKRPWPTPLPDALGRIIAKKCGNARTGPCGLRHGFDLILLTILAVQIIRCL
jgi:hypothetical protein